MNIDKIKPFIKQHCISFINNESGNRKLVQSCLPFYLLGLAIVIGMKYYYSLADCNDLNWILAPTARWAGILSGIYFEREADIGYVNHDVRFIIAASCSGVQFMIVMAATLIFSFVHRMHNGVRRLFWVVLSLVIACLFTVFVNGLRIVAAIYLPLYLQGSFLYKGWLTPERLHTIIGIVSYFTALLVIHHSVRTILQKTIDRNAENDVTEFKKTEILPFMQAIHKCISPMFWYFSITLGIPFLNRAYQNNLKNFLEYTMLMAVICVGIVALFCRRPLCAGRNRPKR